MSRNAELARVFAEIADVLDLTGANAFRVNAHRKVARAVEECGEDVAAMALADPARLRSIPGIGDSSAHKIEEWARTGRVAVSYLSQWHEQEFVFDPALMSRVVDMLRRWESSAATAAR